MGSGRKSVTVPPETPVTVTKTAAPVESCTTPSHGPVPPPTRVASVAVSVTVNVVVPRVPLTPPT